MINALLVKLYLFELKIECEIQAKIGSKSVKIIAKIGLKTGKFAPDKRWFWQWIELYWKLKPSHWEGIEDDRLEILKLLELKYAVLYGKIIWTATKVVLFMVKNCSSEINIWL